mmetsp:Transcript_106139/g.331077  ORF Transcript_106139/g.331077 Transcript_106139/m.331077 type:complete len:270 (-) Transcript_106139:33-842(-)
MPNMCSGPQQPLASSAISESCSGGLAAAPPTASCEGWLSAAAFCSCCCNIHSTSVLAFRPDNRACSSSPGPSGIKVRTTRGLRTCLFFCFIWNVFSVTLTHFPSSECSISFITFIVRSAMTLFEVFSSSNFTCSVPCSTKTESACWKSPAESRSVQTSCWPARIRTYTGVFEGAVKAALCTRIIISKSSKGSTPVARRKRLAQPQSRILQVQSAQMPQTAQMARSGPRTMPHMPMESPMAERNTRPIMLSGVDTETLPGGVPAREERGP